MQNLQQASQQQFVHSITREEKLHMCELLKIKLPKACMTVVAYQTTSSSTSQ